MKDASIPRWERIFGEKIIHAPECPHDARADMDETVDCECYVTALWDALHLSSDMSVVKWLLGEARANIAELADDLKTCYLPDKGWPPHIDKAAEVIAEIDDMLGSFSEHDRAVDERDRAWIVLDWLAENIPGALELCPYKARR